MQCVTTLILSTSEGRSSIISDFLKLSKRGGKLQNLFLYIPLELTFSDFLISEVSFILYLIVAGKYFEESSLFVNDLMSNSNSNSIGVF